jgi:hypothetical protein
VVSCFHRQVCDHTSLRPESLHGHTPGRDGKQGFHLFPPLVTSWSPQSSVNIVSLVNEDGSLKDRCTFYCSRPVLCLGILWFDTVRFVVFSGQECAIYLTYIFVCY